MWEEDVIDFKGMKDVSPRNHDRVAPTHLVPGDSVEDLEKFRRGIEGSDEGGRKSAGVDVASLVGAEEGQVRVVQILRCELTKRDGEEGEGGVEKRESLEGFVFQSSKPATIRDVGQVGETFLLQLRRIHRILPIELRVDGINVQVP